MTKPDPLVAALTAVVPSYHSNVGAVQRHFGDRPDVAAAILAAHQRAVSKTAIADILTAYAPDGVVITAGAVDTWLKANKPKG